METKIRVIVDTALRGRCEFTYQAIEEELAHVYAIGDDRPTIDDDELHCAAWSAAIVTALKNGQFKR